MRMRMRRFVAIYDEPGCCQRLKRRAAAARPLNGQGKRRSVFRRPQVTTWHSACGDFICCPRYLLSAPLLGRHRFEVTHDRALGPTGLQDVAWSLRLSLPVTHRDCTLQSVIKTS
jgi:hypothetical protein